MKLLLYLSGLLAAMALIALAGGCAAQPKLIGAQAKASADAVSSHVHAAHAALTEARPHADLIGQGKIDVADRELTAADVAMELLQQGIQKLTDVGQHYKDLWDGSWFGGKTHSLWQKFLIFLLLFVLAVIAFEVFTQGGVGWFLGAIRGVLRWIVGIMPVIGGPFIRIVHSIEQKRVVADLSSKLADAVGAFGPSAAISGPLGAPGAK